MFDIGFSELLMFGVIALIVLGPEKLPQAARTAGQWYAKIRRTVSTLQSEIEAELDLAETREQMQKELAKIRQTEADMKREMSEMRGNMKAFESSQNQSLKGGDNKAVDLEKHQPNNPDNNMESELATPSDFDYAYHQDSAIDKPSTTANLDKNTTQNAGSDDTDSTNRNSLTKTASQPTLTRPWESMWFRLGAYDKNRRLPAAPYLPNYKADILLYTQAPEHSLINKESDK